MKMKGDDVSTSQDKPLINNLEECEECEECGEHVNCKHIIICEKCVDDL